MYRVLPKLNKNQTLLFGDACSPVHVYLDRPSLDVDGLAVNKVDIWDAYGSLLPKRILECTIRVE